MNGKVINQIDSVGSFLLPERLVTARARYAAGMMDSRHFLEIENDAVEQLVEHQIEAGLGEVTSGEFRRNRWNMDFWFGFDGVRCERVDSGHIYQQLDPFTDLIRFTGRLAYNPSHPFFDDFLFLHKTAGGRARCRQTIPSPANLYLEILDMTDGCPESIYSDTRCLLSDIAEAYKRTIHRFYEIGCRHIQIDDTACGLLCDDNYTKRLLQGGVDLITLHEQIIELLNNSVAGIPSGMELSIYLSGGDTIVPEWEFLQFPDNIMPKVLSRIAVGKFFMPFGTDDYQLEVLRYIPFGKKVVLGLTDAHSPYPENTEYIIHALDKASRFVPRNNLSVSPRTGFKLSSYMSRGLTYEDQWDKIKKLRITLDMHP